MDLFFRIAFGCAWGALVLVWAGGWRISKPTSRTAVGLNSLTPYLPVLIGVALILMHVLPESWDRPPSHLHRPDSGGRRHWAGPGQGNRVIHGGAGFCQLLAQNPRGREVDYGNLPNEDGVECRPR